MTSTEILVVGGGIAGTSTACYLAELGHQVTVLERGDIASEASGVNAGSITVLGWGRMPDLQSYLTAGSLELFEQLALDLDRDIELRASGALQAIHTEAQHAWCRDRVLRLRGQGYSVDLLTARDARAIEPAASRDLLGYVHYPKSAQADPVKATRAFADVARERGARILVDHAVSAIQEAAPGRWRVSTPRAEFEAETLVLAAGAWCAPLGAMLGLDIPVVPVRGQMWATAPLPPRVFVKIASAESAFDWAREANARGARNDVAQASRQAPRAVGGQLPSAWSEPRPPELTHHGDTRVTRHLYGRQTRDGEIIFGGDRQLIGYDKTIDHAGIESNRAHAASVLPFLKEVPIARTWAGLMPFSLDGKPLIGRVPEHDGLYILSGLASSGFGRGPMAGRLLAEFIHTGHRPHVLAEADPARCVRPLATARR